MKRVRPSRPWAPIAVSALVLFLWWVVAHNSGSGWVQVLGDVVFGTIVVGILGPAMVLLRTRAQLSCAPTDGTAGEPIRVELVASSRVRIRPLEPPGAEAMVGPSRGGLDDRSVILVPSKRGVHPELLLEVASAAPFGLQWWSTRLSVTLPVPLHVAPRRGAPILVPPFEGGDPGHRTRPTPSPVGETRAVRPYRPGDQRRFVHWPSTAHAARLMVREMEDPSAQPITLHVSLPHNEELAELLAERALATALHLLENGTELVLATDEGRGPVIGPVFEGREAGRRLGRATSASGRSEIQVSY